MDKEEGVQMLAERRSTADKYERMETSLVRM